MSDDSYRSGVGQVTPDLFIGGAGAAAEAERLRTAGVTHVLTLYEEGPEWPEGFTVCHLPVEDGVFLERETLARGVSFVREATASGRKALVVCGLGISRSATYVMACLLEEGYGLREAYRLVRRARPQAWPMRALWASLTSHYGLEHSAAEIEAWRREPEEVEARSEERAGRSGTHSGLV